jgi:hypothetical protein
VNHGSRQPAHRQRVAPATRLPESSYLADEDGRFRIEGLASALKYTIEAGRKKEESFTGPDAPLNIDVTVQAGETKDLGNLVFDPAKAANR